MDFAALTCYRPPPRYLRSCESGPTRVADYMVPNCWQRGWKGFRRLLLCLMKVLAVFALIGLATIIAGHSHYDYRAAQEDYATLVDLPERIELFDSAGRFFGSIPWGTTRHSIQSADELPQHLIDAFVVMEDRTFFQHSGVSLRGIARAAVHDAKTFSLQHGGSTGTVQLAKMWKFGIPKNETSWAKFDRKFLEMCIARRIEAKFSKQQILAAYMNRIDFGGGFHGIHAAAEGYFAKDPKDLSIEESATLIAILRGPGMYSPIEHPAACRERRDLILRQLAKAGKISEPEAKRLAALPLITKHKEWAAAQHSSEESRLVARELRASGIPEATLAKGGLKVVLTLDREWDARCAASTKAHLATITPHFLQRPLQAAAIVIETRTGAIKALQCGRGDAGDQLDRVFQSSRQAGSLAKPFVFERGFAAGLKPQRVMRNDEIAPGELWPGVDWSPKNAGDQGPLIPCRDGLIFSQNRLTVRVGAQVGLPVMGDFLEQLGVCKAARVTANPSALIGSFETRLADITRAFTIFPLDGREAPPPHLIESVQAKSGDTIFRPVLSSKMIGDAAACRTTAGCLREVFTRGTAHSAVAQVSTTAIGKTGSTNKAMDCWFVGADGDHTCGVWIGCDRPAPLPGGSGAKFALPLWVKIMQRDRTGAASR